jgi:hypothetical protein
MLLDCRMSKPNLETWTWTMRKRRGVLGQAAEGMIAQEVVQGSIPRRVETWESGALVMK